MIGISKLRVSPQFDAGRVRCCTRVATMTVSVLDGIVGLDSASMPVEIDIEHVARLARLQLSEEERANLRAQLVVILEHAAKVGEVAADDVPPTAWAIPRAN